MRSLPDLSLCLSVLPLLLLACSATRSRDEAANPSGNPGTGAQWSDAAGATVDPQLTALTVDLWEEMLRGDPVFASNLGDDRYLGKLKDLSVGGLAARRERLEAMSTRAAALDGAALVAADRVTLDLLREELERTLIFHDAHFEQWLVNPSGAPHVELQNLVEDQPAHTEAERELMLARWAAMPVYVEQAKQALLAGKREGRVGSRASIEKTIAQLDELLARSVDDWPLGNPKLDPGTAAFTSRLLLEQLRAGLRENLAPALASYRAVLHDRLLPVARSDAQPGLSSLPGGRDLYARLILAHTGLPLTARELHDFGLAEIARIRHEMTVLGEKTFGPGPAGVPGAPGSLPVGPAREDAIVAMVQKRLRSDPALHFSTRDEVEEAADDALLRAEAAMSAVFGLLPPVPCDVVRIAPHEERDTTIAYYREPAADGSRPGRYYINTYAPETRPRYEAEVLAFHESIPGHHLQISIAQELHDLPRFRREGGPTA